MTTAFREKATRWPRIATAGELIPLLRGVRRSAAWKDYQWTAEPPCHSSKSGASLSFGDAAGGGLVIHCWACGGGSGWLDDLEERLGVALQVRYANGELRYRELAGAGWLTAAPAPAERERPGRQLAVAPPKTPLPDDVWLSLHAKGLGWELTGEPIVYAYRNAWGGIVLLHCRFTTAEGKQMRRIAWGKDGWQWHGTENAAGVPLYNLVGLLKRRDVPVLMVEGEKSVKAVLDNPRLAEYVPTCPLGGANPVRGTDWSPLQGRDVLVLPDNDAAGGNFLIKVAVALRGIAAEVLEIKPAAIYAALGGVGEPPPKWDIADGVEMAVCLTSGADVAVGGLCPECREAGYVDGCITE